ncbi:hypothetical protein [Anabaena azotica]|nr:hypothetical protein [Anabaena azotica]
MTIWSKFSFGNETEPRGNEINCIRNETQSCGNETELLRNIKFG